MDIFIDWEYDDIEECFYVTYIPEKLGVFKGDKEVCARLVLVDDVVTLYEYDEERDIYGSSSTGNHIILYGKAFDKIREEMKTIIEDYRNMLLKD